MLPLLAQTVVGFMVPMGRANVLVYSQPVRAQVRMKKAPSGDEDAPVVEQVNIDTGSIVEFHDPTHGAGTKVPVLGIVQSTEHKSKGGTRVSILDATGKTHSVMYKAIHITLPPFKGKQDTPAEEILKEYESIQALESDSLGVDPELLELAWEVCAEDDKDAWTPKAIMSQIDETLIKSPLDAYRCFRLLTSDLGKVFFKALDAHNLKYKPKNAKSVKASKDNWCNSGHSEAEWCFV